MKGKRGTTFALPLVVVATTLLASASPAHGAVEVPAVAIWTMVGTPDGNRIFVSAVERGLIAVDADDTVTQVAGIGRSIGIRMGEDGRTLWVGLPHDRQIAAVDSVTLRVTARYPVGADICPGDVVQTGRYVVFGYSCFSYSEETLPPTPDGIGVLDTQTGTIQRDDGPWRPIMSTSLALPGRVLWAECCMHEVNLQLLDVTGGTPRHLGARKLGMMNPADIAVAGWQPGRGDRRRRPRHRDLYHHAGSEPGAELRDHLRHPVGGLVCRRPAACHHVQRPGLHGRRLRPGQPPAHQDPRPGWRARAYPHPTRPGPRR